MIIAFASGKGGTGKTTVSTNLAWVLGQSQLVQYVDCDVEEPNGHLFLHPEIREANPVTIPVPEVDQESCTHCGACSQACRFHAIAVAPAFTLTFPELCHGCGLCSQVCPTGAIREVPRPVGVVESGRSGELSFLQGRMNVGESMSPPVIRSAKKDLSPAALAILDAPPGTSCPASTAITGADLVVVVGEPTRFGLHDLSLAVELIRGMGLQMGVVINRADWGDDQLERYLEQESIPMLGRLPHDRRIAETASQGVLAAQVYPEIHGQFIQLADSIMAAVRQ